MAKENGVIAEVFCPDPACTFTPQSISVENMGPGADLQWLQGRKIHHDRTHTHVATLVIHAPKAQGKITG